MDTQQLLNQLLATGRDALTKGKAYVETQLGVPAEGPEREVALTNMGKGAAAAGLAALLLGTRAGRAVTGGALKVGGVAAMGGLVYNAYRKWQGGTAETEALASTTVDQLSGHDAHERNLALLKAMIGAAKCDGHIDENEQNRIDTFLTQLDLDDETLHFLKDEIAKPLNIEDIAAGAVNPAAAAEIYLTSLIVIDADNDVERKYLTDLSEALALAPELVAELEAQHRAA